MPLYYPVRLTMQLTPVNTAALGEPQRVEKYLSFDGKLANRESAIAIVNQFFDELEKLQRE